jgi:hypothetical protein
LHEEVHQLNNQLHPYVPPRAVEMDLDEDDDPKEPEALAEDDDPKEPKALAEDDEVDGDNGDVSELDNDHDE